VGRSLSTSRDEAVQVWVHEEDGKDEVFLIQKSPDRAAARPVSKSRPPRAPAKPAPPPAPRRKR
jgi:hypothetical protein